MKMLKIAEGAYFVTPYSVQTLTKNYDTMTAKQFLYGAEEEVNTNDEPIGVSDDQEELVSK